MVIKRDDPHSFYGTPIKLASPAASEIAPTKGNGKKMKQSVETYIISLLNTTFPGRSPGAITAETDLIADLDVDSMAMVSLIFAIDEEYSVGTDQLGELVVNCRTAGDLISATERLKRERN